MVSTYLDKVLRTLLLSFLFVVVLQQIRCVIPKQEADYLSNFQLAVMTLMRDWNSDKSLKRLMEQFFANRDYLVSEHAGDDG